MPDKVMKFENTSAPNTMAKIMAVVAAVSCRQDTTPAKLILRRATAISRAPVAPMPAHSVEVNTPP